ncbi:MAG: alpha/beta hydrolase [Caldimonas sp.]
MSAAVPHVVEAGDGPAVLCLHSNASTSGQWRALTSLLADRFRVLAVDGYGAGKSPEWQGTRQVRLDDEVALLATVIERAGDRFHLVGHSYGGAVAVKLASACPGRVRSLCLYEPTLFHLVAAGAPSASPAAGIWHAASDAAQAVGRGDSDDAAERFIDFWMGAGAWTATPAAKKPAIAASMRNVAAWRDALFGEDAAAESFARLDMPTVLLHGDRSPQSALAVVEALTRLVPGIVVSSLAGLGHMGPVTHAAVVNARIESFLESQPGA